MLDSVPSSVFLCSSCAETEREKKKCVLFVVCFACGPVVKGAQDKGQCINLNK